MPSAMCGSCPEVSRPCVGLSFNARTLLEKHILS
jgi:hypothetical protein